MKKTIALLLLFLSINALSGCQSSLTDLAYIESKGTLVVGFTDFPPMGFTENGVATGFDIDIARLVAERMGLTLETRYIDWDSKVLELNSKRIDVIWNGLTITADRALEMTFSKPYFDNNLVIVSKISNPVNTVIDLANLTVGVEMSSSADIALSDNTTLADSLKEIKKYNTVSEAVLALNAGLVDVIITDEIYARYELLMKTSNLYQIGTEYLGAEQYGIGFRLGDTQFKDQVDSVLDDLQAEGLIAEISILYFGVNLFTR